MTSFIARNQGWIWPIIALILIAPFTPTLDIEISGYFYHTSSFQSSPFYTFMFNYGALPSLILSFGALGVLIISWCTSKWIFCRKPALVLVLTMLVGSGIITHLILKDHWGRPRPRQIIEFGGDQPFRPFYKPNFHDQPEPSKSFPSGHVSTGFYFFALVLVARRQKMPKLFWGSLIFTFVLGGMLTLTRIAQGAHFFSDALVSAVVMWLTAYCFDNWVYKNQKDNHEGINQTTA